MLADLGNRASRLLTRRRYAPAVEVQVSTNLLRLGSAYGGWTFEPSSDIKDAVIVSCGLGEDASFDVEFASRFGGKVIIMDPTPRAVRHFEEIQRCMGQPAAHGYAKGGKQPVSSYDLRKLSSGSLILESSALWVESTLLNFYVPANPNNVSHSIVNYQNKYKKNTSHIEVRAITMETLLKKYQITNIPLLKLDIEGAEIEVISHLLENSICPRQLLVEFDEMTCPSERSKKNVEDTDRRLRQAGYTCRYFDGSANFLYVLSRANSH